MNDLLVSGHVRFKEMPFLLKYLFFPVSLLGILFAVSSLIPFGQFEIDGKAVSYSEWWSSGAGLRFTVTGFLLFISGIGFFLKKRWACVTFLAALVVALLWEARGLSIEYMFGVGFWITILGWYFFFKKSMRSYFGLNEAGEDAQRWKLP